MRKTKALTVLWSFVAVADTFVLIFGDIKFLPLKIVAAICAGWLAGYNLAQYRNGK